MNVIILIVLIFAVLSLANKYLKVPRDNNQRYDGINNRFYGEGYTGDTPVPPADDNGAGDDQADQGENPEDQEENPENPQEVWQDEQTDYGEEQPENTTGGNDNRQPEDPGADGAAANTPVNNADIFGNIGEAPGVVIDTEVRIDPPAQQDSGKS